VSMSCVTCLIFLQKVNSPIWISFYSAAILQDKAFSVSSYHFDYTTRSGSGNTEEQTGTNFVELRMKE
jgi:hypothetical protein